jgi:hypothetical protein
MSFLSKLFDIGVAAVTLIYAPAFLASFGVNAAIASFASTFAASILISRAFAPNPPSTQVNNIRQQVPPDPTAGIPIVYGDAYTGGRFVDAALTTNQQTMYYVMVISCISPNGQFSYDTTKFYYQDQLIGFDTSNLTKVIKLTDGAGNVDTSINNQLYIYLYTSNASGVITPINTSLMPSDVMSTTNGVPSGQQWTGTRQMNGTAFAIVQLNYNGNQPGTVSLQPITFHVSHYLNGAGCAKPGDVWYDYLTNTVYGGAIPTANVDTVSVAALNAYSDQTISYTTYTGSTSTIPRYRFNGMFDTGQTVLANLDIMMQCCDCWQTYQASTGLWTVSINQVITPSLSFNDSNIIGNIDVGSVDITQQPNQVEARYNDATNRDQPGYVVLNLQTLDPTLLYPNEPVNKYSVSFELINDSVRTQYLATRILEQNRIDLTISFATNYTGIQANAGDVVTITNASYGWTNKQFRVMQVQETTLPDGSLGAAFQCIAYDASVYTTPNITEYHPTPNSNLAYVGYFSPLSAPSASNFLPTATVPNFQVDCTMPTYGRCLEVILFYTTVATPSTTDWTVWGTLIASNTSPYVNGTVVSFQDITLPSGTYYFAFIVSNESAKTILSPSSSAVIWNPNPTTSAVAGTFLASFSPPTMQVPRTGGTTPVFTGIITQLYGSAAGGGINFVTAQTDSDPSFVNNSWRIGASATTGNTDINYSGITLGAITGHGTYAQWGIPTAMTTSPATVTVPVRYKSPFGTVTQDANAILNYYFLDPGAQGTAGSISAQVYLYQWSTSIPSGPTGTSTYTWSSNTNSSYTGGGGWTVNIPTNPGTPGVSLFVSSQTITATSGTTSTTVSWSGASVYNISQNGANGVSGVQSAQVVVYQWAITIPSGPTGTSTYTWSTATFTPVPSGWSTTISSSPSPGYTLWAAVVYVTDSATATSTTVNWTSSSIIASGYSGTNGSTGSQGASARICYAVSSSTSLNSTPSTYVTSGSTSFPPYNEWGGAETWQGTIPSYSAGQSLFQSNGIYDPVANQTTWNVPYLSNLKVGQLSAISTNTGSLTVTGTFQANTAAISGTTMTGSGAVINSSGTFALGSSSANITYNGTKLNINGLGVVAKLVQNGITPSSASTWYTLVSPSLQAGLCLINGATAYLAVVDIASGAQTPFSVYLDYNIRIIDSSSTVLYTFGSGIRFPVYKQGSAVDLIAQSPWDPFIANVTIPTSGTYYLQIEIVTDSVGNVLEQYYDASGYLMTINAIGSGTQPRFLQKQFSGYYNFYQPGIQS